jgi:hypothetical protein
VALTEVHLVVGIAVMVLNLVAGVWGVAAWAARRASVRFWYVLRTAQGAIVLQVLLGAVLLISGREAKDGIHYMYGSAPLLVNLFAEGMRVGAAQRELEEVDDFESLERRDQILLARRIVLREIGVMTISALLVTTLLLRAAGSAL